MSLRIVPLLPRSLQLLACADPVHVVVEEEGGLLARGQQHEPRGGPPSVLRPSSRYLKHRMGWGDAAPSRTLVPSLPTSQQPLYRGACSPISHSRSWPAGFQSRQAGAVTVIGRCVAPVCPAPLHLLGPHSVLRIPLVLGTGVSPSHSGETEAQMPSPFIRC